MNLFKKGVVAVATAGIMAVGGLTAATTASAGGADCYGVYAHKSRGWCVQLIEESLRNCGYRGFKVDRYYSKNTRRAVRHFQSGQYRLKDDGKVDPRTFDRLMGCRRYVSPRRSSGGK